MTCEQNAKLVLGYLESEETVLKGVKEVLESQLMRLQIDEMNLRLAYQNLKTTKKPDKKKGIKVKKEPEVKTEVKLPKQMTNSNAEALELKLLPLGPISKLKTNDEELPELLLEPIYMVPSSNSKADVYEILEPLDLDSEGISKLKTNDEELPELLLEPIHMVPSSNSKADVYEILEPLDPDSEEN